MSETINEADQEASAAAESCAQAEPTPGPWSYSKQSGKSGTAFLAQVWGADGDSVAVIEPQAPHIDEVTANARLVAAAGTAASELPVEYDPVTAVKVLDDLLAAAELLRKAGHRPTCAMYGSSSDTCTCGWEKAREALVAARKGEV